MNKRYLTLIIIIVLICSFIVAHSTFKISLSVSGISYVRSQNDLRIVDLKIDNLLDAYENSSSTYTKKTTNFDITLSSPSSSVTYLITITNLTGKYFFPKNKKKVGELYV